MLLVNNMLDCSELEERVCLRAEFTFLGLEDVIRVRVCGMVCVLPCAWVAPGDQATRAAVLPF